VFTVLCMYLCLKHISNTSPLVVIDAPCDTESSCPRSVRRQRQAGFQPRWPSWIYWTQRRQRNSRTARCVCMCVGLKVCADQMIRHGNNYRNLRKCPSTVHVTAELAFEVTSFFFFVFPLQVQKAERETQATRVGRGCQAKVVQVILTVS